MSRVSDSDGNSSSVIDQTKVFLAHRTGWTLKSLGIELEESVQPSKTKRVRKKPKKVKKR